MIKNLRTGLFAFILAMVTQHQTFAQCNVASGGAASAASCGGASLSLGAGEYRTAPSFVSGVVYTFSFTNNAQSNGACVGGTQYTSSPFNLSALSGSVNIGIYRNTGTWTGTSATLNYQIATPTTASISSTPAAICQGGTTAALTGNTPSIGTGTWSCTAAPVGGSTGDITFSAANSGSSTATAAAAAVAGNYTLRWRIDNGGCVSDATTTLTVAADPAITGNPTSPAAICQGGTTASMAVTASGGTPSLAYQWQYNNGGTWANVSNGTPAGSTYTNGTSASGFVVAGITAANSYSYRCYVSATGAGCATPVSGTATVSVVADPSISSQPSSASAVCVGGATSFTYTAAGGTPSLTHQWQYSPDGVGSWSNVADNTPTGSTYTGNTSTTLSVTNVGSSAGTYYYRSLVNASGSDCGQAITNVVSVQVVADPSISSQPTSSSAICLGGATSFSYTAAGGTPSLTHQWQYSPDGVGSWSNVTAGTPTGSTYSGATTTSLSITNIGTVAGTYYYRSLVNASASGCGQAVTDVVSVQAVADPSVTTDPSNFGSICQGGTASFSVVAAGGTPSLTYQWQYNNGGTWEDVTNNSPTGASYTGNTTSSLSIASTTATGTFTYRVRVGAGGSGCGTVTSATATFTVVADPAITVDPSSPSAICIGGTSANMSVTATGGTPSLSYQWQYNNGGTWGNVSNGTPAGSTYTNATSSTGFNVSGISGAGSYDYRCFVSAAGSGCGTATSATATVTVVADPSISVQPTSPAAICVGGTAAMSITASGGTPSTTYQWQRWNGSSWVNVADGAPLGVTYTGATTSSFSAAGFSAAGTIDYRCVVAATASGCDALASSTATVTIVADPSLSAPASGSICKGGTISLTTTGSGGTPSLSYQWQYDNGGTWVNVSNGTPTGVTYSGATSNSLSVTGDNATSVAGTYSYRVIATATGSDCNQATSSTATVTIEEDPAVTASPTGASICQGGSYTMSATANRSSDYQWQVDISGTWTNVASNIPVSGFTYTGGGSGVSANPSLTINTTNSTSAGTYTYRVVFSDTDNGCATAATSSANLVIVADPAITSQNITNSAICAGGTTVVSTVASGGTPSLTYQWQYDTTGGGVWANVANGTPTAFSYSGGGVAASMTITTTNSAAAGTYRYRAVVTSSGNGCAVVTTSTLTLTVNNDPSYTVDPVGDSICVGGSTTRTLTTAGGTPSRTHFWYYFDGVAGSVVSDGTPAGFTYTVNSVNGTLVATTDGTVAPGDYQFYSFVTSTGSGCNSPLALSDTITIRVANGITITAQPAGDTICPGATVNLGVSVSGGAGLSYQWQYHSGSFGNVVNGTPTDITYTNATSANMTVTIGNSATIASNHRYRVNVTGGGGCGTVASNDVYIGVRPDPVLTAVLDNCDNYTGGTYNFVDLSATSGSGSYNFKTVTSGGLEDYELGSVALYRAPITGSSHVFSVVDYLDTVSCNATASVVTRSAQLNDISYNTGNGTATTSCNSFGLNDWVHYLDPTGELIMSIDDNGEDLGAVSVDVYVDPTEPIMYDSGPDTCAGYEQPALRRHYVLGSANAPTNPVTIRIYFTDDELQDLITASQANGTANGCPDNDDINSLSQMYITKYTGTSEDGDYTNNDAGGVYRVFGDNTIYRNTDGPLTKVSGGFDAMFGTSTGHHYVEFSVTEFSEIWAHGSEAAAALPVNMLFFEANAVDNSYIKLSWATASEINNSHFSVERSTDGVNFVAIGTVTGAGNVSSRRDYGFNDMDVVPGQRYYYRLKQVDFDGAYAFTQVVTAEIRGARAFEVSNFVPNPTNASSTINITSFNEVEINVDVFNVLGAKVSAKSFTTTKGQNKLSLDMSQYAEGTYTVNIYSNNEMHTRKLMIIK